MASDPPPAGAKLRRVGEGRFWYLSAPSGAVRILSDARFPIAKLRGANYHLSDKKLKIIYGTSLPIKNLSSFSPTGITCQKFWFRPLGLECCA